MLTEEEKRLAQLKSNFAHEMSRMILSHMNRVENDAKVILERFEELRESPTSGKDDTKQELAKAREEIESLKSARSHLLWTSGEVLNCLRSEVRDCKRDLGVCVINVACETRNELLSAREEIENLKKAADVTAADRLSRAGLEKKVAELVEQSNEWKAMAFRRHYEVIELAKKTKEVTDLVERRLAEMKALREQNAALEKQVEHYNKIKANGCVLVSLEEYNDVVKCQKRLTDLSNVCIIPSCYDGTRVSDSQKKIGNGLYDYPSKCRCPRCTFLKNY